jgi:hypothetical protein
VITFGKSSGKETATSAPTRIPHINSGKSAILGALLGATCFIVSAWMWFAVYQIPLQRPFGGLLVEEIPKDGWAPFWVPLLISTITGILVGLIVCRKVRNPSWKSLCVATLGTVGASAILTSLIKNLGYTLLVQPEAGFLLTVAVFPRMLGFHTVKGPFELLFLAPQLLLLVPIVVVLAQRALR